MMVFGQTPVQKSAPPKAAAPAAKGTAAAKPAATKAAAPRPAAPPRVLLTPALLKAKAPETYKVRFTTTKGDFVVQVTRAWAPMGADRFYNLVKNGFFTDVSFFRVLPGFVAQFGLSPYPAVSRVWKMANLTDDPVRESNRRGTLSFATAGPNTRTTQIFINLNDNVRLDQMGFSPFALVTEGMDVVDKFYTGYGDGPPSGPDQGQIQTEGKPYLDKAFPNLDSIKSAVITDPVAPAAAPAAAKPVAPAKAPATAAPKATGVVKPATPVPAKK